MFNSITSWFFDNSCSEELWQIAISLLPRLSAASKSKGHEALEAWHFSRSTQPCTGNKNIQVIAWNIIIVKMNVTHCRPLLDYWKMTLLWVVCWCLMNRVTCLINAQSHGNSCGRILQVVEPGFFNIVTTIMERPCFFLRTKEKPATVTKQGPPTVKPLEGSWLITGVKRYEIWWDENGNQKNTKLMLSNC